MLIRLRCRTGTKYPIQGKGVNGPAARHSRVRYTDRKLRLLILYGSVYLSLDFFITLSQDS